jgi:hypothetical protein
MLVMLVMFVIATHLTSTSGEQHCCVKMKFFEDCSVIDRISSSFLETVKCFDIQRGRSTRSWQHMIY